MFEIQTAHYVGFLTMANSVKMSPSNNVQ